MKIRSLLSLFILLFASLAGQAQNCHTFEVGEVVTTLGNPTYAVEITVFGIDAPVQSSWFTDEGFSGDYGEPQFFGSPCGVPLQLTFRDRSDTSCFTQFFLAAPQCQPDSCANFGLERITGSGPCTAGGPVYEVFGGEFPMELLISSSTLTDAITLQGPERIIDLSDYDPDSYNLVVTEAGACVAGTSFIVGTGDCGGISGWSWRDEDGDGIRGPQENTAVQARVTLRTPNGAFVALANTQGDGFYDFGTVGAGTYLVSFQPSGNDDLMPTQQNQGDNELIDSDINESGETAPVQVFPGEISSNRSDAGWVARNCFIGVSSVNPDCGEGNGSITVDSLFGQGPVTYAWSADLANTSSITDLVAGIYTVTVTFADGCQATRTVSLTSGAGPVAVEQEGSLCDGEGVTLTASIDDTDPVGWTYVWSTEETTRSISVLQPGRYFVTVTSPEGCNSVGSTFVNFSQNINPLEPEYRLDCETGTVLLTLPEDLDPEFANWVTPEGDFQGDSITISTPGGLFLEYFDSDSITNCQIFGQSNIVDPRFGDELEMVVSNSDSSVCSDNVFLFVNGLDQRGAAFDFAWTDANGPIGINRNSIRVEPTGLYQVVVTSECGSVTLQYNFGDVPLVCQDVSGRLFLDADAGCSLTAGDIPIPGNLVEITSVTTGEQYFAFTNAAGEWGAELPEGTYTVTAMYDELAAVGACPPTTVTLAGGSVANVDVFIPVIEACPLLSTSISAWRLRRCFRNQANIFYENRGTGAAAGAELTLLVDPFFEDITANLPFTRDGDVLTFDLGDVPVFGTGTILLNFTVSCDAELGQLHCLEAGVTPNEPCLDPENWDGAVVNVSGARCNGDDEIVFTIRNVGETVMSVPMSYVIIEDGIMMLPAPTVTQALEPGEGFEITLAATGGTFQVVANQEPNAPASSRPSDLVEGCNGRNTGFGNLTENGNGNPGESVFCRENIGSYDPNEKLGFPIGFTEEHDIEPRTTLTYELHFQNTGTDTAFTVVVRDTLSELYDLESIKLGAGSHEYTATLDSQRVLTFTFNNILLPDSTTNLLGSQGVVTFTIDPLASLERGTRIRNRAGIYFDFNEPIVTDYMNHRIAPEPILLANRAVEATEFELSVFPNPTDGRLNVTLDADGLSNRAQLVVADIYGREMTRRAVNDNNGQWNVGALPAGYYLLLLEDGGLIRGRSAFVIAK